MAPTPLHRSLACVTRLAWTLSLVGCSSEAGRPATTVRDSAGVAIVENDAPDTTRLPAWGVSAEPTLDIGRLEGSDAETLFRVVGAVRLSDGRVAVANAGTSEVRYYRPDGAHLRSAGGEGGGPGEFQRIVRMIPMPGDSLAVMDPAARRLSVLDPDGGFAREVSTAGTGAMLDVVGRQSDGSWVASQAQVTSPGGISEGLVRGSLLCVTMPAAGGALDTVASFPGDERVIHVGRSGGTITSVEIATAPFGRTASVLASGGDLVVATRDAAQVEVYGRDGTLRRIVRTGVPLRPVTTELVRALLERRYAELPPDRRRAALEAGEDMPTGPFVPPYGSVALDRSGRLWVQDFDGLSGDNRWTVYARDGTAVARLALPGRFTPYDIGEDWIVGRELDELEVEHVRLYGITRP